MQYVGRLLDGSIFDTTYVCPWCLLNAFLGTASLTLLGMCISRDIVDGKHAGGTDDAFEFQLGREKVIKGWDIGVATMAVGEIARFIIAPEYAYGQQGFAPKVCRYLQSSLHKHKMVSTYSINVFFSARSSRTKHSTLRLNS